MPLSFLFDNVGTGEDKENARIMKKCDDGKRNSDLQRLENEGVGLRCQCFINCPQPPPVSLVLSLISLSLSLCCSLISLTICDILFFAVFRLARLRAAERVRAGLQLASHKPRPPDPVIPQYCSVYKWPVLPKDYLGEWEPEVWAEMPKNELPSKPRPWIDPEALRAMGEMIQFPDMGEVDRVAVLLTEGAHTGVSGAARLPQEARNSPKIQELGPQVLDTIRSWLEKVNLDTWK